MGCFDLFDPKEIVFEQTLVIEIETGDDQNTKTPSSEFKFESGDKIEFSIIKLGLKVII